MNVKKLMSTALLLLVGAGVAVGDGLPPADGEAPAASASPESENLAFQSGGWVGLGVGGELGYSVNRGSGRTYMQQDRTLMELIGRGTISDTQVMYLRSLNKTNKANFGTQGFTGGIHFGYDCKLRDRPITLGVLLGGGFGTGKCKISYPYDYGDDVDVGDDYWDVGTAHNKLKHGGFFDIATRFGYVIGRVLPFVKVGWGIHHYTFHPCKFPYPNGLSVDSFKAKSKWFNCVMVGLGIDVMLKQNILIGLVSDVDFCAKKRFNVSTILDPRGTLSVRPRNFRTMATIKYKFPTCKQ